MGVPEPSCGCEAATKQSPIAGGGGELLLPCRCDRRIGPNGAGKSSCFAAVTNSITHAGRTFLEESDVSQVKTYDLASHGLRRTFQHNSFFGELTILQNAAAAIVRDFSASLADRKAGAGAAELNLR